MEITISIDGVEETKKLRPFDTAYIEELSFIEQMDDEEEKERRYKLLEEIEEKITAYYIYEMEYNFRMHIRKLSERGIVFTLIENATGYKSRWSKIFASSVSKEDKKRIHYEQFRWHIYSFEFVDCLKGDEARKAFNACPKQRVYQFFQEEKTGYCVDNAQLLKAEDLDYENIPTKWDTYLFDPNGQWTYIRTHEDSCGPYFFQK